MNLPGAALRIVIVAPESLVPGPDDEPEAVGAAERSRSLRIGLLEGGYNIVAVLPSDMFLPDRIAQIQPELIIVDAESQARRKALARGLEVRKYLIGKGVRSNRIDVRALGTKSEGGPADRVDIVPSAG